MVRDDEIDAPGAECRRRRERRGPAVAGQDDPGPGRLRRADNVIADAAFLDLPSRVSKKLLELGELFGRKVGTTIQIDIRLRQQDFAGMVSATRESVNRSLANLEEEGIIKIDRQKITILKPDELRDRIDG